MADSFQKKEREKKRRKRKEDKKDKKLNKKNSDHKEPEFMYVDHFGNLTATPPDPANQEEIELEDIQISIPKSDGSGPMSFVKKGVVKFFKAEEQYGFIKDTMTNKEYYINGKNIKGVIKDNDKVSFEITDSPRGKVATNVEVFIEVKEVKKVVEPKDTVKKDSSETAE